jgi:putative hydrolase of the HAD superfamily
MASGGAALSGKEIWSRLWNDFDRDVIGLVHRLRATHKVGVLSNTTLMLEEHVLIPNGIHDIWDVIINSARVGVAKPDARIYEMAAETIGVAPAECVHIDDLEHNVRGAEGAGFQAILHRGDFGELTKALNALGVEC